MWGTRGGMDFESLGTQVRAGGDPSLRLEKTASLGMTPLVIFGLRPALFLRRFAAGVAAERTRLGGRRKNPHISRKERASCGAPALLLPLARSGAAGFDLGFVIRVSAHVGL